MTEPNPLTTAGTWHDHAPAVAATVATALRLESTHPDRERAEPVVRAGMRAIDLRLELRPLAGRMYYEVTPGLQVTTFATDQAPDDLLEAVHQLAGELYRRKDAPFGVTNAWSPTGEPVRVSRDQLAGVESLLQPYIEGWGLA